MGSPLEQVKDFLEFTLTPSPIVFIVGIAFVLLFPFLLHWAIARGSGYATLPSVLLLGPSGSGKTSLVTLLERRGPRPSQTHTTQVVHSVELAVADDPSKPPNYRDDLDQSESTASKFLLVDTPGHGKLRGAALDRLHRLAGVATAGDKNKKSKSKEASKLKAVVFLADAAALADQDELSSTAAYLYDVLLVLQKRIGTGTGSRHPASVPVLVAANKADLFTALPPALVKSHLEAELSRIRRTRSKALLDSGVGTEDVDAAGAGEQDDWLGEFGTDKFTFDQLKEVVEVEVIGGNIVGDGPGVDKWWAWIADKL